MFAQCSITKSDISFSLGLTYLPKFGSLDPESQKALVQTLTLLANAITFAQEAQQERSEKYQYGLNTEYTAVLAYALSALRCGQDVHRARAVKHIRQLVPRLENEIEKARLNRLLALATVFTKPREALPILRHCATVFADEFPVEAVACWLDSARTSWALHLAASAYVKLHPEKSVDPMLKIDAFLALDQAAHYRSVLETAVTVDSDADAAEVLNALGELSITIRGSGS